MAGMSHCSRITGCGSLRCWCGSRRRVRAFSSCEPVPTSLENALIAFLGKDDVPVCFDLITNA
nr:hypothetical protein BOSE7B_60590 [Bosea sp. 7B]